MEILGDYKAAQFVIVRVDPGECLQATLEKVVQERGGNAMVLSALGSVSKVAIANPKSMNKENIEVSINEFEGPFELISLIGGVGTAHAHGRADSHLHIAVAKHDGAVLGGGLRYGTEPWFPIQVYLLFHE